MVMDCLLGASCVLSAGHDAVCSDFFIGKSGMYAV